MVRRPTQGVLRMLTLCSGMSSSCSRLQTKTRPARGKINLGSMGILPINRHESNGLHFETAQRTALGTFYIK
jgi:hypothetical protein